MTRVRRRGRWLDALRQDVHFALRVARRVPGFTAIVVATLALAIGSSTAIFSVLNVVLLRPLPFPHPEQLVLLYAQNPDRSIRRFSVSYADYRDWRRETRSFTDMAVFAASAPTLVGLYRALTTRLARRGGIEAVAADPAPVLYLSYLGATSAARSLTLIVRASGSPASVVATAKAVLRELDPELTLYDVQTLRAIVDASVAQPRLLTLLLGAFAGMALLLAAMGIYGVVSFSVAQRTQEIGVRMALGAREADVLRLVLGEGAVLAAVGVVVGLVAAFAATSVIQSWLFGIERSDPITLGATAVALMAIALAASYVPARRATTVDPLIAMRAE